MATERERMLRGEYYDPRDPELLALANRARELLARHAATAFADAAGRHAALEAMLGQVGAGVWIEPPFFCEYGVNVRIGDATFVNTGCVFLDSAEIRIGRGVLLGPGVQLLTPSHPVRARERIVRDAGHGRAPYRTMAAPITIGDECWIGAGTIVMPGVSIGDGVTVGAGSLVTRDIPGGVLAYGHPCTVREQFD